MIIRENYLSKIRPFIGKDIIKVLTGIRRGGKSVLLEQIRDEINSPNTIFLNFEDLGNHRLCEYNALHNYVCEKIGDSKEQFYLFWPDRKSCVKGDKRQTRKRKQIKGQLELSTARLNLAYPLSSRKR